MRPFLWTAWSRFWNFKKIEEIFKRWQKSWSWSTMRNVMIRNSVDNERNMQRKDTHSTLLCLDMSNVFYGWCVSYPCTIMRTFRSACFKINKTTLETIKKNSTSKCKKLLIYRLHGHLIFAFIQSAFSSTVGICVMRLDERQMNWENTTNECRTNT